MMGNEEGKKHKYSWKRAKAPKQDYLIRNSLVWDKRECTHYSQGVSKVFCTTVRWLAKCVMIILMINSGKIVLWNVFLEHFITESLEFTFTFTFQFLNLLNRLFEFWTHFELCNTAGWQGCFFRLWLRGRARLQWCHQAPVQREGEADAPRQVQS